MIRKNHSYNLLIYRFGNYKKQNIMKSTGLKLDDINIISLIKEI